MASGLLSLKWNNHRTTFFHVLSTVRSKESYCDVTLACDGKFYPVHKLVLSTCSDYFERMFERTNCKHPIIVLKDIRHEELEALLNYMYVGEVNVLQNELAGLIKAAECLMIKGLAVPDEAPSKESKRSFQNRDDSPHAKRRRKDEDGRPSSQNQHLHRERERGEGHRERGEGHRERGEGHRERGEGREPLTLGSSNSTQRQSLSASMPSPSPTVARVAPPPISPSPSVGSVSDAVSEECSQSQSENNEVQESSKRLGSEQASSQPQEPVPEVILDEAGVKEEPEEVEDEVTETKDILESQFSFDPLHEGDSRSDPGGGSGGFDSQMMSSQPQSMEELVAQAIPGSSGLQGNSLWGEGDGSLQGFPMEGFSGDGSRPPQMGVDMTKPTSSQHLKGQVTTAKYSPGVLFPPAPYGGGGTSPPLGRRGLTAGGGGLGSQVVLSTGDPNRREFVCQLCGYQAISESKLTMHIRRHTGEKPFTCLHCPYRSAQKSNLSTHVKNVHLGRATDAEKIFS